MTRRSLEAVMALLVLGALVPGAVRGQDRLPIPVVPAGFGVNIHFFQPDPGEIQRFASGGFGLARMDVHRRIAERPDGSFDFSACDVLIANLAWANTRPLLILWSGETTPQNQAVGARDPASIQGMARFAAEAARRYKDFEVLWEIWNEPNQPHFWQPRPDPTEYLRLAVPTARAIHQADPNATVLGPGTSKFPWPYLEALFRGGLLAELDAVSVHPYRLGTPESVLSDYAHLRGLIARYAPTGKKDLPIVSSEWGYSTAVGQFSEARQAQYLVRQYLVNLSAGVRASIFYDWRDDGPDPRSVEHRFGTVRQDLTPKPAFLAARDLTETLRNYTLRHRLAGGSSNDWRLLFQERDNGALMLVSWSADSRAPDAQQMPSPRPIPPGDPEFPALNRLASIRLPIGPLGEAPGDPAVIAVSLVNPEPAPCRVEIELAAGRSRATDSVMIPPDESAELRLTVPRGPGRLTGRAVPVRLRWNGQILPAVVPLTVSGVAP